MNTHWKPHEDKIEKRLGCYQGKLLYMGSRVNLLNAYVSTSPLYMLSFYRVHVGVRKRMDIFR
jgi:hypothetical protein